MTLARLGGRPRRRAAIIAVPLVALLTLLQPGADSASAPADAAIPAVAPAVSPPVTTASARASINGKHVIAISVDGLTPLAIAKLGRTRAPYLHKLIYDQGAGTTDARSQVEMTITLPNHTSMVTGRRISRTLGGHGVTWNDDSVRKTVHQAAGHDIGSVFREVHAAGGRTAVFATKSKFWLFERSWPSAVDKNVIKVEQNTAVTKALREDLISARRAFYFLHLGLPDQIGHHYGWMSAKYLDAVAYADRLVGSVMRRVRLDPALNRSTVIIVTSDHGGTPGTKGHSNTSKWQNYRVPFAIWGAGVANTPLYTLNPTRKRPGLTQPAVTASPQPVRNGEMANLALDILGLGPVPGSLWDHRQDLDWN